MKKCLLVFALSSFCFLDAFCQSLIAVQNNNTPQFFSEANEAFDAAVEGDTLYFPAGSFSIERIINKRLHIIGVGHNPEGTSATGATIFADGDGNRGVIVYGNGGGGTLTGISFVNVNCNSNDCASVRIDSDINGLIIDRVYMPNDLLTYTGTISNLLVVRSILRRFSVLDINGFQPFGLINNNIILTKSNRAKNISIESNIFFYSNTFQDDVLGANGCNISNNIFLDDNPLSGTVNSSIRNNFGINFNGLSGSNISSGNINSSTYTPSEIFTNYFSSANYSYEFDLTLLDGTSLIAAATDGGQIGIYGGRFPWKDGSIPFNPHIISKNISGTTDENGNLQIEVEVQAQGN
ncbi:hypothetical protein ACFQ1Q_05310 [Winogradskyella litorisediminis]|uniref:Pectate lyase superfamily protein domain-containing protein n=1 Tax=Winogradskyella litorisediminis TaxID=1156618 RepID=A0ABW3N5C0_9FLAO